MTPHQHDQAEARRERAVRRFLGPERYREVQRAGWYAERSARAAGEILRLLMRRAMLELKRRQAA